jgi:acyl dehydratase
MTATAALLHEVNAFNLSAASENKIHDDTIAKKFGFQGGLVPGVEVYAYMTNLPMRQFGAEWLSGGSLDCRFQKPVYDGKTAVASSQLEADGSVTLKVESEGVLCGSGSAEMGHGHAAPSVKTYAVAALPDYDTRPAACPEALVEGKILGTFEQVMEAEDLGQYLVDVREDLNLYAAEKIVHPGWLLRLGNRALSMNVKLGPWIHVGSKVTNFAAAHYDDTVQSRATVARVYEHKGHRFVELDVLLVANGETAVAHIYHTAIYHPRQVAEAS